jgi:carbon-monoxide dehydrogenase large subunit
MGLGTFGTSIKRREDPRLIQGRGTYTDNMKLYNMAYAYILRSPHPHAKLKSIDASKAKAMAGVVAVFVGSDFEKLGSLPCGWQHPGLVIPPHPVVAKTEVNYIGDPVAVVIAEDRYTARDAADAIEVEYEALPVVMNMADAIKDGSPKVHDGVEGMVANNSAFKWQIGDQAKTDAAFAAAAHVSKLSIHNNRIHASAIEPRACLASYESATDQLTIWMTSQNPHIHRLLAAAFVLGLPEHKVRVIAPDVGGGFGSKIFLYNEEIIMACATRWTGRPVKWTSERREAYLSDAHGRDHDTTAEMAFDKDGKILGIRVHTLANMGAYLSTFSTAIPTYLYGCLLSGQYDIPAIHCAVQAVFTNTVPVDAVRGAGRPEATFVVERLVDTGAHELGIDAAEIRRRNFVKPDNFPFQTQVALAYDSGNYEGAMSKALEMVGYADFRAKQKEAAAQGKYLGIGFSSYIEACGLAPSALVGSLGAGAGQWESALVRVMPTGMVNVYTGSHAHGQGHETTFAQIASKELGMPYEHINIIHGDTDGLPYGWGTYGSRSAAVGGSALVNAARRVKDKATKIAAHLLEANEADIELVEGKFQVKGVPAKSKTWFDVALMAHLAHNLPQGMEPGLEFTAFYDPSNFTYPFGTHVAIVEVDGDTGQVALKRYVAVDDVGNQINPMIVEGQLHGGIAHGIGQALLEEAAYTSDGQLLGASLMDYALPKASNMPSFELGHTVTPCPHNPLGVKGAGEAGAIASPAAVVNAVIDALQPLGVKHIDMPLTPQKVWKAMQEAKK